MNHHSHNPYQDRSFKLLRLAYFAQGWRWWDLRADTDALEHLDWKRRVHNFRYKSGSEAYRVILQRLPRSR